MASFSSSPSSPWADLVLGLERASAPTSPDAASALLSALAAVDARAIDDDNVARPDRRARARAARGRRRHARRVALGRRRRGAARRAARGGRAAAARRARAADRLAQYHDGLLELQASENVLENVLALSLRARRSARARARARSDA